MDGLTVGRIIHYVGVSPQCTAGIVTRILDKEKGIVNLTLFPDLEEPTVKDSIPYEEEAQTPRSWHWPKRA